MGWSGPHLIHGSLGLSSLCGFESFAQIWYQSVIRQINNNLSILSLCFLLFHLANSKIPVIAAIHLHLCYSLHVDVACSFFYDWYIEQRYSIDTLLILGICQCGSTILGDLPIFFKLRGRNTGISIYFLNNKNNPHFCYKIGGGWVSSLQLYTLQPKNIIYFTVRTDSTYGGHLLPSSLWRHPVDMCCVVLRQSVGLQHLKWADGVAVVLRAVDADESWFYTACFGWV